MRKIMSPRAFTGLYIRAARCEVTDLAERIGHGAAGQTVETNYWYIRCNYHVAKASSRLYKLESFSGVKDS